MGTRSLSHSLSCEEEEELVRSNKKVKDARYGSFNEAKYPGFRDGSPSPKASFKDKLVGVIPGAYTQAFNFLAGANEDSDSDDEILELREGIAVVKLSKEEKQRIRAPWAKTLIVKVFRRTVGFTFLQSRLLSLWKPMGRIDIVDLGKEFYLVRFYLEDDHDSVLYKGPWFIGENFLSICPWEPNFKPSTAIVSSIAVWIRLNELPIEYYEANTLKRIGATIGSVLRVDSHTAVKAKGRYARLCVQVDINKPFITLILIGDFEQFVNYEGIQRLCFACGRIGHRKESCPFLIRPSSPLVRGSPDRPTDPGDVSCKKHEVGMAAGDNVSTTDEQDTVYGPWLVVTRRRHDNRPTKKVRPIKDTVHGPMDRGSGETSTNASPPKSFIENKSDGMRISKRKTSLGQDVMGLDRSGVMVLKPVGAY